MNGKIKPIVYTAIKRFALRWLLELETMTNTDANIGPIQGVHPKLNVKPNIKAVIAFISLNLTLNLFSLFNIEDLIIPM